MRAVERGGTECCLATGSAGRPSHDINYFNALVESDSSRPLPARFGDDNP
jgi:hypothetical protein